MRITSSEYAVPHSVSDSLSFSWSALSALPRGRTGRGVAGHKLIGHAEQIPQHIGIDARQAHQHRAIAGVVVRHIVNTGVRGKQLRAVIEIHAHDKRAGFGRAIRGDARQEFSMDLQCRLSVRCALLHARQREPDIPHGVEVDCVSGHGHHVSFGITLFSVSVYPVPNSGTPFPHYTRRRSRAKLHGPSCKWFRARWITDVALTTIEMSPDGQPSAENAPKAVYRW